MNRPPDIELRIPGESVAQGRPRFVKATGRAHTPAKTRAKAWDIQAAFLALNPNHVPHEGPVRIEVVAVNLRPKGCWEGKRVQGKPDVDNVLKLVADALSQVAYTDDAHIDDSSSKKRYGDRAETVVRLWFDEQVPKPPSARELARLAKKVKS